MTITNGINIWIYYFVIISCILGLVIFIRQYKKYKKYRKYCSKSSFITTVSTKRGKKIPIYQCPVIKSPCVIHPIIVLPDKKWESDKLSLIIEHELNHIYHHDIYYKILFNLVLILHFYNPIAYMLLYTWNKTAELYCDKSVIKNKTNKEIEEYGTLIIDLATTASYSENRMPIAGLNLNKRHLSERIANMKNHRKTQMVAVLYTNIVGNYV